MSTITTAPTADDVRAFAQRKGIKVAARGRLSFAAIEAFNKGRKVKYVPTWDQPQSVIEVAGRKADKAGRNRPVTYKTTAGELRAWGVENGFPVSDRGRLPHGLMAAFANREAAPAKV